MIDLLIGKFLHVKTADYHINRLIKLPVYLSYHPLNARMAATGYQCKAFCRFNYQALFTDLESHFPLKENIMGNLPDILFNFSAYIILLHHFAKVSIK